MSDRTLTRLPEHSIYTVLCGPFSVDGFEQPTGTPTEPHFRTAGAQRLYEIAQWACRHIRGATLVDFHTLMARFAMKPIDPQASLEDVVREARRVAKRFALEEIRQAA